MEEIKAQLVVINTRIKVYPGRPSVREPLVNLSSQAGVTTLAVFVPLAMNIGATRPTITEISKVTNISPV